MSEFNEQIELLKRGGIILYPTDTIWGLGCDATNEDACQKIIKLKDRPSDNSFIILVDSFQMVERYVPEFHEVCYELVDSVETPLTIIYPTSRNLAPSVVAKNGSIGIRITKDPICRALIRGAKKPLLSTSANLSGKPFPSTFDEINNQIRNGVDAIVSERQKEKMDTPSQIIEIGLDGRVKVIRA